MNAFFIIYTPIWYQREMVTCLVVICLLPNPWKLGKQILPEQSMFFMK